LDDSLSVTAFSAKDSFMLRSIKQLYGNTLGASDGEIGQVKDFYFDDQNWAIRYLVVDTGLWLPGRQVLISPHSVGPLDQAERVLRVNLTRKQIENGPSIESHKPVSRQYEEEYYRHYGLPCYWQGDGLWGAGPFPILEQPPTTVSKESIIANGPLAHRTDAHLRSTQAVNGYHVRTGNGVIGYVCDFMMDAQSWAIGQLVVKTGHRFSGNEELIPMKQVDRISYEESTIFVDLNRKIAGQTSAQPSASVGVIN
jgi:uncharacterized protein YrrD